jgi:membrane-associated phospholipid phosphatase
VLALMATFYVSYSIFLAFPVAGPRYEFPLAQNAATSIPIATFTQRMLNEGAAWGTAFPSSHVAVALVVAVTATLEWPPLGLIVIPLAFLLTLSTVYGQFHYAVDAAGGVVLATSILGLLHWWRRRAQRPR